MTSLFTAISSLLSFQVIWNVPSQPCVDDFGIHINFSNYRIIQNENRLFIGDRIALFYNLGVFPQFVRNATGAYDAVNGGIPQNGNLSVHLEKVRRDVASLANSDFCGIGVIDFEDWRADFDQNFDQLQIYQEESEKAVAKEHPDFDPIRIKKIAKSQFNIAARLFFEETLKLLKKLTPDAMWGFYHYPYCFASSTEQSLCANSTVAENNRTNWLYEKSGILLPSLYMGKSEHTFKDRAMHIYAQIQETIRVNSQKLPFMPYMSITYEDSGEFLENEDLVNTVGLTYDYGGAGVIVWGSSSSVNSAQKCVALKKYVEGPLGRVSIYIHNIMNKCSEYLCGNLYRCQPRLKKLRKKPFISRIRRLNDFISLWPGNRALARRLFRKEFRCIPAWYSFL